MLKRQAAVTLLLVFVGVLCVNNVQAQSFKQWAVDATATSEYTSTRFSAAQMVGAPDTYPTTVISKQPGHRLIGTWMVSGQS